MGHLHTEETKKKISETLTGRKRPPFSDEWKRKIGENNALFWKGKKLSKEHIKKLSESHKGISTWNKGLTSKTDTRLIFERPSTFKKGHVMTEEIRIKISRKLSGENNHLWMGGISNNPYPRKFNNYLQEQIRKRDNYRCQECFKQQDELFTKKGRKYRLHVHHIDYNKENCNLDNLISLCRDCHLKTNFNRKDWIGYFEDRLWQH